jgi:hypothetical protein
MNTSFIEHNNNMLIPGCRVDECSQSWFISERVDGCMGRGARSKLVSRRLEGGGYSVLSMITHGGFPVNLFLEACCAISHGTFRRLPMCFASLERAGLSVGSSAGPGHRCGLFRSRGMRIRRSRMLRIFLWSFHPFGMALAIVSVRDGHGSEAEVEIVSR